MSERTRPADDPDDLFAPALAGRASARREQGERPWRLGSQFYVAFFGGILAGTAIAWINAGRLGVGATRRRLILAIGAAGLVATILAVVVDDPDADASSAVRLTGRIVAVIAFAPLYALQKSADRIYSTYAGRDSEDDDEYDSLWIPGLAAAVGLGLVQAAIVYGAVSLA